MSSNIAFLCIRSSFLGSGQFFFPLPVVHWTATSSACVQDSVALNMAVQFVSTLSFPVHCTLLSHILPVPSLKFALLRLATSIGRCIIQKLCQVSILNLPESDSPSCLHTTLASVSSHIRLQTVPHSLLRQISRRPSV